MENENKNQLQIELKEEVAQGTYANLAIITHSSSEFILDFVRVMPGLPKAGVQSRIVMTPEHAKRLMFALQDNVKKLSFGQKMFMIGVLVAMVGRILLDFRFIWMKLHLIFML